jgi:hypothetical protein
MAPNRSAMMVAAVTNSAVTAIFVASMNHIMSSGDIQSTLGSETVCAQKIRLRQSPVVFTNAPV